MAIVKKQTIKPSIYFACMCLKFLFCWCCTNLSSILPFKMKWINCGQMVDFEAGSNGFWSGEKPHEIRLFRTFSPCQNLTFFDTVPKALEPLVSTAFASFLMRSNYFQTLSWPLVPTVSVYSVRQSGINCGQKKNTPRNKSFAGTPRVLPRNDDFHLGGALCVCYLWIGGLSRDFESVVRQWYIGLIYWLVWRSIIASQ